MVTNKQGRSKAAQAEAKRLNDANEDAMQKSIREWREMQGLPPRKEKPNG